MGFNMIVSDIVCLNVIVDLSNREIFTYTSPGWEFDLPAVELLSSGIGLLIFSLIAIFAVIIALLGRYSFKTRSYNHGLNKVNTELSDRIRSLEKNNRELDNQLKKMERELSNSERLYGMLLTSAEDGIAFYNTKWELAFANPAYYSLIGMTEEEYKSLKESDRDLALLHPDDIGYADERKANLEQSGIYEAELRIRHVDSSFIVLSSKSVTIKDDNDLLMGYLVISRDITSIKETQKELITAKERAEESNRLKSTFLANISHEIRTPLNSIVGFANLLNDVIDDKEVREEYIGYLNSNTERLLQIISDIIDLSRLENSEIEIHYDPVRINPVLDYVESYTQGLILRSGKKIEFVCNRNLNKDRDIVYTDELWLKRVFRHLLDNAVKFTRAGKIEVSSAMAGTSLMFTVKDTGIGISKEHLQNIFEQFRQEVDGHHRPFEGLGVGLTLTKHVVEQMDGYLWVESEKGNGSEFFFTIPYRPVEKTAMLEEKEKKEQIRVSYDWQGKKILIADDNHDILKYLNRILSDTGVEVVQARSGEEALKMVVENKDIDLVLLDMQMEEMNGLEATREIRKIRPAIPIVAQTAFIYEEEQDIILDAGCDACLIKPVRQEQLYSVVSNFLSQNDGKSN